MPRRGFTAIEVLIVCLVVGLAALFLVTSTRHGHHQHSSRTKCSNNLRQLGLAALQYGDDKRFLPHVGPLLELDGDFRDPGPTTTTKAIRSLLYYGYHDSPEGFVCPSSFDLARPRDASRPAREWFWGGQSVQKSASPFVDGLADPAVVETDELSYGWTRKGLNSNCRHNAVLAADRAVVDPAEHDAGGLLPGEFGNHRDGWNVLYADASVTWLRVNEDLGSGRTALDMLTGVGSAADGYLAIRDQRATLR